VEPRRLNSPSISDSFARTSTQRPSEATSTTRVKPFAGADAGTVKVSAARTRTSLARTRGIRTRHPHRSELQLGGVCWEEHERLRVLGPQGAEMPLVERQDPVRLVAVGEDDEGSGGETNPKLTVVPNDVARGSHVLGVERWEEVPVFDDFVEKPDVRIDCP
jgi:hypothetical protein